MRNRQRYVSTHLAASLQSGWPDWPRASATRSVVGEHRRKQARYKVYAGMLDGAVSAAAASKRHSLPGCRPHGRAARSAQCSTDAL
jgi:hypothetical protein